MIGSKPGYLLKPFLLYVTGVLITEANLLYVIESNERFNLVQFKVVLYEMLYFGPVI